MKKLLLLIISLIMSMFLTACGEEKKEPIPVLDPSQLITAEELAPLVGYQPILDGGAVKYDGNKATALYRPETLGSADIVEVTVVQYSETYPLDNVWYTYDESRMLRQSAENLFELGESAFIAYPSINVFDRGCYLKITAGSGNDDNQKNLLLNLAKTAIIKLEGIMPETQTEDNAVEQK